MSKRKKRQEVMDKRDSRKFFTYLIISVLVLMLLLYLVFKSM